MQPMRPLTPGDIPGALALSTQAGWNQLDADWRRLITLWPDTCLGGDDAGRLAVSGTLAAFGPATGADIAWIGMILVEQGQRGKGLGTAMMTSLLELARKRRIKAVGLDATDMGKPVYEKLGFVSHSLVSRWIGGTQPPGPPSTRAPIPPETQSLNPAHWPMIDALDLRAVGVPRGALLRALAAEPGAAARVVVKQGRVCGFGFSRRGRTAHYIGPIVAETLGDASALFDSLLAARPGQTLIDVPDVSPLRSALTHAGFLVQRRLTRMLLPLDAAPPLPLTSSLVYAGAGFELG